jgi:hypothetical protein
MVPAIPISIPYQLSHPDGFRRFHRNPLTDKESYSLPLLYGVILYPYCMG